MILVCGGLADPVTELVCSRIEYLGYEYHFLNLGLYPEGYRITWTWEQRTPTGVIDGPDWSLDLADISGVFIRFLGMDGHAPLASIPVRFEETALAECQAALAALLEDLPCLVVNRMAGSPSNQSKPYQGWLVRRTGLRTPPTLITNDPAAAREFYDHYAGEVIFKSVSGIRSIVRRMEARDLDRLPYLRHGVTQFQAYVPGDNIRVHTVGDQIFATHIRSTAVDYRYAHQQGAEVELEPTNVTPEVARACQQLASTLGLPLTGIDLKQTPAGEWYCFEVNPAPFFAYYEKHTGQPISAALVELLRVGQPRE
jgi:glutathione synthase/RimK-type ligase-like ATP-grasp enzyme